MPDVEQDCPVCLEPLSFSFRLPGEKPHIVPECGHALHEACFTAVYGPPPSQSRSTVVPKRSNLGVCGVCRRPMKVGDGDSGKSNKLASLTGMGERDGQAHYPGGGTQRKKPAFNPNDDDPVDSRGNPDGYVVAPSIQVRPEFSSLTRTQDQTQPLTCIVVVELPGKRAQNAPGPVESFEDNDHPYRQSHRGQQHELRHQGSRQDLSMREREGSYREPSYKEPSFRDHSYREPSFRESSEPSHYHNSHNQQDASPFASITEDLRARIIDWKGHPLSDLGPLQKYDLLTVRRDSLVREFYVYLFREAIICVAEEKKRSLGRLLSNASGMTDSSSATGSTANSKGVLRLKGRIYVRHIKHVTASSAAGEMSLTIDMEDDLASFILIYKDRQSMEAWKAMVESLVGSFRSETVASNNTTNSVQYSDGPGLEEFGGSSKAMRMLSGGTTTTVSTAESSLLGNGSSRNTMSSSTSHGSGGYPRQGMGQHKLSGIGEDDEIMSAYSPGSPNMGGPHTSNLVTPYMSSGPSNSLSPLPHPPIDLILVISIPPPSAAPSTAQLKVRVIKGMMDFVLASLGGKDRVSFVTFEVGVGGRVKRTPFLSVRTGARGSRERLERFVEEVCYRGAGGEDIAASEEFLVRGTKDEKSDVVTAVNHGKQITVIIRAIRGLMNSFSQDWMWFCNANPKILSRP